MESLLAYNSSSDEESDRTIDTIAIERTGPFLEPRNAIGLNECSYSKSKQTSLRNDHGSIVSIVYKELLVNHSLQ